MRASAARSWREGGGGVLVGVCDVVGGEQQQQDAAVHRSSHGSIYATGTLTHFTENDQKHIFVF